MVGQPSSSERLSAGRECLAGRGCHPGHPVAAGPLHPGLSLPVPLGLEGLAQLGLEVWGALSFQPFPQFCCWVSLLCFSCCCPGYSHAISLSAKAAPERAGALGSLCTLPPEPAVPAIASHFKALPLPALPPAAGAGGPPPLPALTAGAGKQGPGYAGEGGTM